MIKFKEELVVLLLNNSKRCIGWSKINAGRGTATIVDPSSIFQVSLLANTAYIIIAHNHPSGNLIPLQARWDADTAYSEVREVVSNYFRRSYNSYN